MAHLLPQLRCQFAEFLNDCQLKRLRILYQLTCGSFQVRFTIKKAEYNLFSLSPREKKTSFFFLVYYLDTFLPPFSFYAFSRTFYSICLCCRIKISSSSYPLGSIQRPINFPISLRREGPAGHPLFRYSCQHSHLGYFLKVVKRTTTHVVIVKRAVCSL